MFFKLYVLCLKRIVCNINEIYVYVWCMDIEIIVWLKDFYILEII